MTEKWRRSSVASLGSSSRSTMAMRAASTKPMSAGVAVAEVTYAPIVHCRHVLDAIGTIADVVDEGHHGAGMELPSDPSLSGRAYVGVPAATIDEPHAGSGG